MSVVLIVEDMEAVRKQYAYDLRRLGGHDTIEAPGVDAALEILDRDPVDCVLLDLEMPGRDGFDLLRALGERGLRVPVIVYTGTGDFDRCVRAVKLGAAGFLDKREPMERVLHEIGSVLERSRLEDEVHGLRSRLGEDSSLLGSSAAVQALRERIAKLAPIPSPVLVLGESGTGKELVARDLHRLSPRAAAPFLAVNCAALPEALVESALFGHERGAFTGADRLHRGAFESAGAGTLFLDEAGDLPLPAQAKLLRVLEDENITRVGGNRQVPVRCRVIAATNRDLDGAARSGSFREDLLYRLNVHVIEVPPLRARREDVGGLVQHFLAATARRFGARPKRVTPGAVALLSAHDWGRNNVRELRNAVERMVIAAEGEEIGPEHVPAEVRGEAPPPAGSTEAAAGTFQERKADAERRILLDALTRNDWHLTRTAKELGLADHASLSKMMKRHGLRR
ncbi:MAG: sigma-54-dependent transcriptional regulator [Candidatus Eiseniibacteriota bacterium]